MYKVYFKQAIQMLKQNKFISVITIAGTALAIMMIMAIVVSYEIKTLSADAEPNRYRTLYISSEFKVNNEDGNRYSRGSNPSIKEERDLIMDLKTPEFVTLIDTRSSEVPTTPVKTEGNAEYRFVFLRECDHNYWKMMSFKFIEGVAFDKEEFDAGMKVAVISETTAKNLYKGENPLGQTVEINFDKYRVIGVVKDVSPVYRDAFSDIWVPYTATGMGRSKVLILARSEKDFPAIIEEIEETEKRASLAIAPEQKHYIGPYTRWSEQMDLPAMLSGEIKREDRKKAEIIANRKLAFIIAILLLVPAVNLSGFSLSRVRKRMSEIGIRKAFGAKKHIILIQVLYENMITSLIGGFIGLLLSYIIIFRYKNWLLGIPEDSYLPVGTLVSLPVWIAVFTACLIINLLSAGIPAYIASKTSIVNSLTQKL